MAIETHVQKRTNVVAWSGWDAAMLDALLDADSGSDGIGFTLARVLASRLLPSPAARFRFRLYRYSHEDGVYRFVGAWDERSLEEGALPQPPEVLERQEARNDTPDPELRAEQFLDDEVFLPLETKNGVLGFGVLRIDSRHDPAPISPEDLHFLGRLGGSALGRLNETDRAVRMHRSFESVSRHLDGVLSMTTEAIVLVDGNGFVRMANEPALALLRPRGEGLLGTSIRSALLTEAADSLQRVLLEAGESDGRILTQVPLRYRGQVRPFEVAVQRLQSDIEIDPTLLVRFQPVEAVAESAGGGGSEVAADDTDLPTDEAEVLRRHVRSIRAYLGLLREELQPRSRCYGLFRQLEAQLEWLQARADVHALHESILAGEVTWQSRFVRTAGLIDRALSHVRARLAVRGVEVERKVDPEVGRVRLDLEKWSVALGVLIDRVTEAPGIYRLAVGGFPMGESRFSISLETSGEGNASSSLGAGADEDGHDLALVRQMVDLHGGTLRMTQGERGGPVVRLELPLELEAHGRSDCAA